MFRRPLIPLLCILLSAPAPVTAKQLYHYVDEHGIQHFSDVPPQTDRAINASRVRTDPKPLVDLATQRRDDGGTDVVVGNLSGGPIEIELSLPQAQNVRSDPPLPGRFVLEALERREVARVSMADPHSEARYQVQVEAIPGDPRTRADPSVRYQLPFRSGTRYSIGQAFGGRFSHTDEQNYHAVDFGVAEGTPVLAARDGVVIQVERDFYESGGDRDRLAARANYVRIMHEDGSMAVYAHLAFESVLVRPGGVVLAGQHLGDAGATGFATGPHLHFVVQRNAGMRLTSIPFRFDGPDGAYEPRESRTWKRAP